MILKINQNTYGDFLRYYESLGMTFDTTRFHKTEFQEVTVSQNDNMLTKSLRMSPTSARIQHMVWTQLSLR